MKSKKLKKSKCVLLLGHKGLIGSSIFNELKKKNFKVKTVDKKKLDLLNQQKVFNFFKKNKVDYVIIAAARAGGILANIRYPFNFIYENLQIQNNLIYASINSRVKRTIFLGSSCIYNNKFRKPFSEKDLGNGSFEKTNEYYAIAKYAGIKLCESYNKQFKKNLFLSVIPPNLFGIRDNFHASDSHVLTALLRKFYIAKKFSKKKIEIWGSGNPKREFLHADDAAYIIVKFITLSENKLKFLYKKNTFHINIGTGKDYSIKYLVNKIKKISNYKGEIKFNKNYPDGVMRKVMDISNMDKILNCSKKFNEKRFNFQLDKIFKQLTLKHIKKFEKNCAYNLPI